MLTRTKGYCNQQMVLMGMKNEILIPAIVHWVILMNYLVLVQLVTHVHKTSSLIVVHRTKYLSLRICNTPNPNLQYLFLMSLGSASFQTIPSEFPQTSPCTGLCTF